MSTSYKPEVYVEGAWSANALRFTTESEAKRYAQHLYTRWTLTKDYRATGSDEPVNASYDDHGSLIHVTAAEIDAYVDAFADAAIRQAKAEAEAVADASFEDEPTGHEWPDQPETRAGHLDPSTATD